MPIEPFFTAWTLSVVPGLSTGKEAPDESGSLTNHAPASSPGIFLFLITSIFLLRVVEEPIKKYIEYYQSYHIRWRFVSI